jgi:O-antigen/teichoic acid export membrane protein
MVRDGGELAIGTAIGQLFPALAAPWISRLYTPTQFGLFAVFVGFVSVLSVIAGGRYEVAILIPAADEEAANVAVVSTLLITLTSVVVAVGGTVLMFLAPRAPDFLTVCAAAIAIAGAALHQTGGYWLIRRRRFRELAIQRGGRGILLALGSVVFGVLGFRENGLMLSLAVAYAGSALVMVVRALWFDRQLLAGAFEGTALRETARKYVDFFRYSVVADMLNALSQQLPAFLLTSGLGAAAAGQFAMAQRTLGAPLGVVNTAMGDVFKEHVARELRETGSTVQSWRTATAVLGAGALLMFAFAWTSGPTLFRWLLGAEWTTAGHLVRLLAPFYALAMFVSPLSRILYVVQWQRIDLAWQIALFVSLGAGLMYTTRFGTLDLAVLVYSLTYSALYCVYFMIIRRAAQRGGP